jgi:predicted nucleotidyltransferase
MVTMDLTKSQILRALEEHAPAIRRYGVRSLGLFGSRGQGTEGAESDLDFVVEFDLKSFDADMDLKAFLEELFGIRVDLVLKDAIKPRLRERILAEALHAPGL